jgi:hypothetical protein
MGLFLLGSGKSQGGQPILTSCGEDIRKATRNLGKFFVIFL